MIDLTTIAQLALLGGAFAVGVRWGYRCARASADIDARIAAHTRDLDVDDAADMAETGEPKVRPL